MVPEGHEARSESPAEVAQRERAMDEETTLARILVAAWIRELDGENASIKALADPIELTKATKRVIDHLTEAAIKQSHTATIATSYKACCKAEDEATVSAETVRQIAVLDPATHAESVKKADNARQAANHAYDIHPDAPHKTS